MVGIAPLGCIPFVRALNLLPRGKCSVEVNTLIQGYNQRLNSTLDQLNRHLGPESVFVYANSYDVFSSIILSYRHYGWAKNLSFFIIRFFFFWNLGHFYTVFPSFFGLLIGFETADEPCCGGNFPPFICFKGNNNASTATSVLCDDRSKYVFWDAYHPTEAVNIIISKMLLDGDESISFPMNIRELYNYNNS